MAPLLLPVLLFAATAACTTAEPGPSSGADAAALLREGDAAFASGAYSASLRHYSDAIELDKGQALFWVKRAAAHMSLRQHSAALRDLDAAVEADGAFTQGYLHRAKLHKQLCSAASARADLSRVLELKPGHKAAEKELEGLLGLEEALAGLDAAEAAAEAAAGGGAEGGSGSGGSGENASSSSAPDTAAARAAIARVLDAAPDCARAQLADAKLDFAADDFERVAAATGRLLKAAPGHLEALTLRGRAYFYLNDHELGKRHCAEALRYDPDHIPARKTFEKIKDLERRRKRAARAEEEGDLAEAEAQLLGALGVDPRHKLAAREIHYGLCGVRRRLSRHEDALASCEAVLGSDATHRGATIDRVRILFDLERFDEAVARAREALSAEQGDHELRSLYQEAERRLKMSQRKDYYKILGVDRAADVRDIKKAYKRLAVQHHPDKAPVAERPAAEARFKEVAEAYEVLRDEEKRGAYDRGEDVGANGGGGGGGFHHGGGGFQHSNGGGWTFTFTM